MKSRVATLDDTHELARLNAVFNGGAVGTRAVEFTIGKSALR